MKALALLSICAGCDVVWGIDEVAPVTAAEHDGCSQMAMLADDFADDDVPTLWTKRAGTTSEQGNALTLDFANADTTATLGSGRYFDLREDAFAVETLFQDFAPTSTATVRLLLTSPQPGYALSIERHADRLGFYASEAGQTTELADVAYDDATMAYWRIANASGKTRFETSADGATYATRASAELAWVDHMAVAFTLDRDASTPPFSIELRDANGGKPHGDACSLDKLADSFDGSVLDDRWARSSGEFPVHDGGVDFAFTTGVAATGGLEPARFYDLTVAPLVVEIPDASEVADDGNARFSVEAFPAAGGAARIYLENHKLTAAHAPAGTGEVHDGDVAYDAQMHRWWRIRAAANQVFYEVSPDGTTWTALGSTNALGGLDRVDVYLHLTGTPTTTGVIQLAGVGSL